MITAQLEQHLNRCVTRGRVLTAAAQLAGYDADGLGHKRFPPDAVVIPADADELVTVLKHARQLAIPICMRGAGTSLSGGPVAAQGGLVIHTSALKNVRQIDPRGSWCEVECGVTLKRLDEALKPHGLFYPPDPSSGSVCTIGGNVAMNAGGAHCFRYGVTGNYVLGVEVVLEDGSVHQFGGPAGGRGPWQQDWKRLMVGSEGTLAAFTRFWLRLSPRPDKVWTFRATYADLSAAERAIHALVRHSSFPVAIELMDPRCVAMVENSPMACGLPCDSFMILTEIDGPEALVDSRVEPVDRILREAGATDVEFSDEESLRQKLWKARKVAGGLMGQQSADLLVQDAVIPKKSLADVLRLTYSEADAAGIPVVNVFHAGDGNLHPNFLFDSRNPGELEKVERISKRLMQRVVEVGGTLSGEHGIGNDKSAYMPLVFGADAMRLQLAVPAVFNPRHQLNPRKVFDQREFQRQGPASGDARPEPTPDSDAIERMSDGPGESSPAERLPGARSLRDSRCFELFCDPLDGILSVSADATPEQIRAQAEPHGLRFPLLLDDRQPLIQQFASSPFASASSRFGPLCDNITGMNWVLPNGRVVRVGERVVKTTTGYDLFRFLLGSREQFGSPEAFVLRLRTDGGMSNVCEMTGPLSRINESLPRLLGNCWMHWLDAVDVLVHAGSDEATLRIAVNCPSDEWTVVAEFLNEFAGGAKCPLVIHENVQPPRDGCPDLFLKTTADRVVSVAEEVSTLLAGQAVAIVAQGVVHGYLSGDYHDEISHDDRERLQEVVARIGSRVEQSGGEWMSRHLELRSPTRPELDWIRILEEECSVP